MIFLVTGGAGFVGANLIRVMTRAYPYDKIISLDNYFTGKAKNHIKHKNVRYIKGDTRNIFRLWQENKLPKPNAVFHLGEYSRVVQSFDEFDKCWNFNMNGTKEVVKFASFHKAKLVYAASSSKFGNKGEDENLSPYSWMKAKNVELIKNYANWYDGFEYVITYFYNVYGHGQIKTGRYSTVIGIFEDQYEKGEPLTVVKPGTQKRDFTHIDDIIEGILVCYEKGNGDGYELGFGRARKIIDVARMFKTKIKLIPARKGERVEGQADYSKVKELGWKPRVDLEDYIEKFLYEK